MKKDRVINLKLFLILIFSFLFINISATPELDTYSFKGKNIETTIIYRYINDIEKLYYKTLTEDLDEYIGRLKLEGKLDRGKIHLEIMTAIWMNHANGVEMYRYNKGYYCFLNGLTQTINQNYLERIVDYFASDNWESFCYDNTKVTPEQAIHIFNKRLSESPTLSKLTKTKRQALKLNNVTVYLEDDSLVCEGADLKLGAIKHLTPFSADSKDIVTTNNTIYVIENGKVINSIDLPEYNFSAGRYEHPWVEVYPLWINFENREGYFLSYSIKKNKFYKIALPTYN